MSSELLADKYACYLKTQNDHFIVAGPHFHVRHGWLKAQCTEPASAIDVIAGRIDALGTPAPGSCRAFAVLMADSTTK